MLFFVQLNKSNKERERERKEERERGKTGQHKRNW